MGHSTAVTSIEWKWLKKESKEIFISCGDDKKVIIWQLNEKDFFNNKKKWVLYSIFDTSEKSLEYETLTYLKVFIIDEHCYLVVATLNGYIFKWSIETKELIFSKRIHYGSIEGLDVHNVEKIIVTASSDCTIGIIKNN